MRSKKLIFVIALCLVIAFAFTGCGNKTAMTVEDFTAAAEDAGYTVNDISTQYEGYGVFESALIAMCSSDWQAEFYVLTDEDNAASMFSTNQTTFEGEKGSKSTETSSEVGNYSTYSLTSDGSYMYLCRVDNTLLYIKADSDYKSDIKEFVDSIGY